MGIKIGSQDITGIYVGSTPVQSVYVGSTLIWSNAPSAISFIFDSPLQAIKNQPGTQTVNGVTYELPEQELKVVGSSNYSIVGSATVTNGIASNFGAASYLTTTPVSLSLAGKTWELNIKVNLSSSNVEQELLRLGNGIMMRTAWGTNKWMIIIGDGQAVTVRTESSARYNTNTDYWIRASYDRTSYRVEISTDGSTYSEVINTASSSEACTIDYIKIGSDGGGCCIQGSGKVWLDETNFKIDGVTVWRPVYKSLFEGQTKGLSNKLYLTKKNNAEQFTKVGNVTITDGVASGFSGSNKIQGPTLDFSKPFELIYSYTHNHDGNYQKVVWTGGFNVGPIDTRVHWLWIYDENGNALLNAKCCDVTSGTKYVFKLTWDGSVYNHYVLSGGSWSLTNTFNSTKKLKSTAFYIGGNSSGSEYLAGTIDLNEFSFTNSEGYSWTPYGSIVSFIATDSSLTPVGFDSYADTGYIVTLNNSLDTITNFA